MKVWFRSYYSIKELHLQSTPFLQPLYYAGMFLFLSGRLDKAREYVDRMLKLNQEHEEGLVLKAWVELGAGKESRARNVMDYLDAVLQK